MKEEAIYYRKIDYLRIIACFMVLLYHLNLLKGGFLAVCTFFTISGYLSTMTALRIKKFSIKSYYINKFKKIYIPLILIIFITLIVFKLAPYINWLNLKQETISALLGYNNYWQLNAKLDYFTKNSNSPFMHLWYISILIQFELIFPILFLTLKKLDNKIKKDVSTIIVTILAIGTTMYFFFASKSQNIMLVYYNSIARSFSIIFGVLLAILHHKYNIKVVFNSKFCKIIFLLYNVILIILCALISAKSEHYSIFMILATIISIRIIEYSTINTKKIFKKNKAIDLLVKTSYLIYLVQYPVIFFMQNTSIIEFLKIPIIIGLTFIISYLMYLLLNFKIKNKSIIMIKQICIVLIIVIGSIIVLTEKDYSIEMKELENKLDENTKLNEEQNNEFINLDMQEQEKEEFEKNTKKIIKNEQEVKDEIDEKIKQLPIVGVGDSVLLGVANEMHNRFPNCYIDGKVSRTIVGGKEVLAELKNKGELSDILVLALANNGDYSDTKNKNLMDLLENREIYWVNAMGADDPKFNERFKEFAKNYPNIHIVDWEEIAKSHPEYLYADGVHIKGDGIKAYVDTIYNAIFNNYWELYEKENVE